MRQSILFYKTLKEPPKDEKSINAQLLIRAGFIDKLAAGIYTYLPLGLRVLEKIAKIIREEMNAIDGQEMLMPSLNPKENWQQTDRWASFEALFKLKGNDQKEYTLAPTHEEVITPLAKKFILSYKDLPIYLYQIQNKFRNELRAKSGLLRAREFIMKDLYSFHVSEKDLDAYYEKVKGAYFNIFKRCGLGQQTYLTLASGGTFSKYSHEFQIVTPAGEDAIYICQKCKLAINKTIKKETPKCPDCKSNKFKQAQAIEAGNIFKLKTKYSQAFDLKFKDKNGQEKIIPMGCYGIGLGRLMGAVVELLHDKKGIVWPKSLTPFDVHLLALKSENTGEQIYKELKKQGLEVLYDDRKNISPGEKFVEADLIGLPWRIIVSEKTLKQKSVELKERAKEQTHLIKLTSLKKLVDLIS